MDTLSTLAETVNLLLTDALKEGDADIRRLKLARVEELVVSLGFRIREARIELTQKN